jgi:hypothetical protein
VEDKSEQRIIFLLEWVIRKIKIFKEIYSSSHKARYNFKTGVEKMAFENFSDLTSTFSLKGILSGDLSAFLPIFYLVVSIAIYSIVIWHFYRFIARRDCLTIQSISHPKVVGFLKYFFVFPFIAFLFFLGFSLMMLFLTRDYEILAVLSTSFAVIVAIRITAYYSRDLSKDVAKMLPFALLGLFFEWILRIILAVKNEISNVRAQHLHNKDRKISTISSKQRIADM